ncbi:MAG: ribosome silencing factor [Spirochaetes bacterium]|nr:ribosome silencing factor [Spirochaetota bacterium]
MFDSKSLALTVAGILAEHKAGDVVVLDLKALAEWTDYFVIGTCSSSVHMRGLSRAVEEAAQEQNAESLNTPMVTEDQSWLLYDLGDVVVHLMNKEAREFYELEKLWFTAPEIRIGSAGLS